MFCSLSPFRSLLRCALLPLCTWVAIMPRALPAETPLLQADSFSWNGCYARLEGNHLRIGNLHIARSWRLEAGQIFPESLLDKDSGREWLGAPVSLPAPTPPGEPSGGTAILRGADGIFGPTEEHALRAELALDGSGGVVRYQFEIFPQATGIRMWVESREAPGTTPPSTPLASKDEARLPKDDVLERLALTSPHIRLIQVTLRDRTDDHNELAFETEWLLHPNESRLDLRGNLFILEDVLQKNGLIFIKEAPEPDMRPTPSLQDAIVIAGGMSARPNTTAAYNVVFTGHGFSVPGRGYAWSLLTYQGGEAGRTAALQRYQRQIRTFLPGRDGLLITNTWGDRFGASKIREDFIYREIDGAKLLGADLMEVDDGWESGKTVASHSADGIWEGYWEKADFWQPAPGRFPHGLAPLAAYAHQRGLKLGLWFGPDSSHDFRNWQRDAGLLLSLHDEARVDAFKLDSVKIRSKLGEIRYQNLLSRLQQQTDGKLLLDLDVTAETRQGYFGNIAAGPLFVENRYTDLHRYWPHQTLRNMWKLSHYVDPVRLRMEFLNNARNTELYGDDPLAPERYDPACLFAITMFSSPLAWFETTGLSPEYRDAVAPLIATWKQHRDRIYQGTILPIGDVPDGVNWTGFTSTDGEGSGYLLAFREANEAADWVVPSALPGNAVVLGGNGSAYRGPDGRWTVHINEPLGFLWVRIDAATAVGRRSDKLAAGAGRQ